MYEAGHSGLPGRQALREDLRRLEATLAVHEHHLMQACHARDAQGAELLTRTAKLLLEEIERLRRLLA